MTVGLSERIRDRLVEDIKHTTNNSRYRTHKTMQLKVEKWQRVVKALENGELTGEDIEQFDSMRLMMTHTGRLSGLKRRAQWVRDIDYTDSAILLAAARKII